MIRFHTVGLAVLVTAAVPAAGRAQSPADSVPVATREAGRPIHWWEPMAIAGGVGGLMLLDAPVHRFTQDHRTATSDDIAKVLRHGGQPEVFVTVPVVMLGVGLVTHDQPLARAGGRAAAAVLLAGGATAAGKILFGRERPNVPGATVTSFHPFTGVDESLPSGHSTVAFALAGSLADDIHPVWAKAALYIGATGVAWSRLNDEKHWLSDVVAGAAVGIYSAKLVDGHWRIFHIHPPEILIGPHEAAVAWSGTW